MSAGDIVGFELSASGDQLFAPQAQAAAPSDIVGNVSNGETDGGAASSLANSRNKNLLQRIAELKAEQKKMKDQRSKVQKDLKNAMRKKKRLQQRARQLSNDDLMSVLLMRTDGEDGSGALCASQSSSSTRTGGNASSANSPSSEASGSTVGPQ
jgi:molecular chaperone GrpE (heat shock protein)